MATVLHARTSPSDPTQIELTLLDPYTGIVESDLHGVSYGWDYPSNDLQEVVANWRKGDPCLIQRHVVFGQTRIDVDSHATKVRFVDDGTEYIPSTPSTPSTSSTPSSTPSTPAL